MRIGILSDIHANRPAMEAVLRAAENLGAQRIWCLGDVIGYGPDPLGCLRLLRSEVDEWIYGNHELLCSHICNLKTNLDANGSARAQVSFAADQLHTSADSLFNYWNHANRIEAITAMLIHLRLLSDHPELEWLLSEIEAPQHHPPLQITVDGLKIALTHGTLKDPTEGYVAPWTPPKDMDFYTRRALFAPNEETFPPFPIIIYGHSHIPAMFRWSQGKLTEHDFDYGHPVSLNEVPLAISPGSAGWPADLDTRAAFAILDTEERSIRLFRSAYNRKLTFKETVDLKGIPNRLVEEISTALPRVGVNADGSYSDPYFEAYLPRLKRRAAAEGEHWYAE